MREAAISGHDVPVVDGVFQAPLIRERAEEIHAALLVGQDFRMHEGHVQERLLVIAHRGLSSSRSSARRAICTAMSSVEKASADPR